VGEAKAILVQSTDTHRVGQRLVLAKEKGIIE